MALGVGNLLGFCCICILLAPWVVLAEIKEVQIERSNESLTLLETFGFTNNGHVNINVSQLTVYSPEKVSGPDTFLMGFFLVERHNLSRVLREHREDPTCVLTSRNVSKLFSVLEMEGAGGDGEHPPFAFHSNAPGEGEFNLYFANCAHSRLVSATVSIQLYNEGAGGVEFYLSAGHGPYPFICFATAAAYLAMAILWLLHVRKVWFQPVVPHTFHLCLTLLLILNVLLELAMGVHYLVIQSTGRSLACGYVANALFGLRTAVILAAFLTGLNKVEPYLSDVEHGVLLLAVPTLVISYAALALLADPSTDTLWRPCFTTLRLVFSTLATVSWGLIILLLLFALLGWLCRLSWSFQKSRGSGQQDDREVENPLARFYVLASSYIIAVLLLSYLSRQVMPFRFIWVIHLMEEVAAVLFFAFVLHRFRPRTEKSVYQLFDESDSVDEELENL